MNSIKLYVPSPILHIKNELSLRKSKFFEFINEPVADFYFTMIRIGRDEITESMVYELRNKKTALIITDDWEANTIIPVNDSLLTHVWTFKNPVSNIKDIAKKYDIEPNRLIYVDANFRMPDLLKRKGLNGIFFSMWESYLETVDIDSVTQSILDGYYRQKKFLFLGGKHRPFRIEFLQKTTDITNFEQDAFISIQSGDYFNKKTKKMEVYLGKNLDLDLDLGREQNIPKTPVKEYYHLESYINIAACTYYTYAHHHFQVNEKILKPICTMQPFIILGQPHALRVLRELGYKTFDKWFDESYDNIIDDEQRMDMLVKEISRLNNFTKEELNAMLIDMLPTLIHNAQLMDHRKKTDYVCEQFALDLKNIFPYA